MIIIESMAMIRRNRQRVLLLYVSLIAVATVIATTNNRHGPNDRVEATENDGTSSDDRGDDFIRLPLHLYNQRHEDEEPLQESLKHSENYTRNKRRSRSSSSRRHHVSHDKDKLLRHQRQDSPRQTIESLQHRREEEDNRIVPTSSLHGKSIVHEYVHKSKHQWSIQSHHHKGRHQRSSQRRLNRGPDGDVMKAIEEDRSELEQILGHPIYHTKSSKATSEEKAKWSGDSWTAGSSTEDPWRGDVGTWASAPPWTGDDSHDLPTGWSDDGWDFNQQYKPHLDNLRADIVQLIEETERELLPKCLRLAFHDCIGGCDGCIDPTNVDNRGLDEPVELLFPLVQKYKHKFSRADVWAYCAVVATDMAVVEHRPDDLQFHMHYIGRNDCEGADEKGFGGPAVEMYTNHMTTHEMIEFFDQRFGLNPYEMVVLMGVHSVAVAVRENTGFGNLGREDGWIHDAEDYKLSNMYYTSMLSSVWEIEKVENKHPVPDRYQWHFDSDGQGFIMTTSDMSLIIDPEGFIITDSSGGEGLVMCRAREEAHLNVDNIDKHQADVPVCPMAEQTRGIVQELEQDNTQFLFAFVSVLNKMITNGYDMHPSLGVVRSSKSGKTSGSGKSNKGKWTSTPTWMPSWWSAATKTSQPVAPPTGAPNIFQPSGVPSNKFQPSGVPSAEPTFIPSTHPSDIPSTIPSAIPSEVPSTRPSVFPSLHPSIVPSSTPTVLPSIAPSMGPSSKPSLHPSISSKPTQEYLPSSSPSISMKPTTKPSSTPSKSPTTNPTGTPTKGNRDNPPTSSPISSAPVAFLTRRPTWSPTISLWPTRAPTTKRPTWAPTISLWPTRAPNTRRPTFPPTPLPTETPVGASPTPAPVSLTEQPTTSIPTEEPTISRPPTFPPSASPSSSPTISSKPSKEGTTKSPTLSPKTSPPSPKPTISQLPTTGRTVAPRVNQQMNLFGLEVLESPGATLFRRNTRQYIEWFYNDYEGPRETIRGQVLNVRAIIRVIDTVEGTGVVRNRKFERNRKKIYFGGSGKYISSGESSTTDEDTAHWEVMSSPSEQRFGEFHSASNGQQYQVDEKNLNDDRRLQGLEELCIGAFTGVQYTIEMAYSLSDPGITLEDIVSEPFSTSEYRNIYLNDWLKATDPIGAFDSVRCSGPPMLFTAAPSVAPSAIEVPVSEHATIALLQRNSLFPKVSLLILTPFLVIPYIDARTNLST